MGISLARVLVFFALLLAHLTGDAAAQPPHVIFVAACGDDAWAGSSPDCQAPDGPKLHIQAAIDAAADGDEVVVAPGTYVEAIDLGGKAVYVHSAGGAGVTVVDTRLRHTPAVRCEQGETRATVLEGFTVQGSSSQEGGGLRIGGAGPTIRACVFQNCEADYPRGGGAVYSLNGDPLVVNCTFEENRSGGGGAIFSASGNMTVLDSTFAHNHAGVHDGGGAILVGSGVCTLTECTFFHNGTESNGGAVHNSSGSLIVTNCRFERNGAGDAGGGIASFGGSLACRGCVFTGNAAYADGAIGGSSLLVENCIFVSNRASIVGGAVGGGVSGPESRIVGSTFVRNSADAGGALYGSTGTTVANSVFWLNTTGFNGPPIQGPATVTYSCVQSGYPGTGNIASDPLLVRVPDPGPDGVWGSDDDDYGDVGLRANSPCIDAGNTIEADQSFPYDAAGAARFLDDVGVPDTGIRDPAHPELAVVDMGGLEFQGTSCRCDWNGSGSLNSQDFFDFLSGFFRGAADFNRDGITNSSDFFEYLACFFSGCLG